ncbi:hypothetical protein NPIL_479911 [Nephila pilipes]|uniref:Uncharacterized protein n=1 Tax=Nephila pilipes TaxID=299642 RepID=A0A8X6PAL9_NEPPI|nr:hypothetical protein NPIL_479911 [Nephila pilipes]
MQTEGSNASDWYKYEPPLSSLRSRALTAEEERTLLPVSSLRTFVLRKLILSSGQDGPLKFRRPEVVPDERCARVLMAWFRHSLVTAQQVVRRTRIPWYSGCNVS